MMSDGGYDYEIVGDIFDDFFCQICLKLMKDAVQLECGHGMCNGCLQQIVNNAEQKQIDLACPKCRKIISKEKVYSATMINQVILCVKVKCEKVNCGCPWIGSIGEMSDHLLKLCEYQDAECKYENCNITMSRSKLCEHETSCVFRSVICEYCQVMYKFKEAEEHSNNCEMLPLSCPNKCTGESVPRIKMTKHLETCVNELIQCTFSSAGCDAKLKRINLYDHLNESIQHHVILLLQENMATKSSVKELQERNQDLGQQLIDLTKELGCTKANVLLLNQELVRTKEELNELSQSDVRKTEHAFVWVENKVIERFNILIMNIRSRIESCVNQCQSEIEIQIVEFDKQASILHQKLPLLASTIDKRIEQSIKEVEDICMPLENLDKVLSSTLLEIEKEIPFEEQFWAKFGSARWEELLHVISVTNNNKIDSLDIKKQLHDLHASVTYIKRFEGMLQCRPERRVYKDGNMLCLIANLNSVNKYQSCYIIANQASEYLTIEGIVNDTTQKVSFLKVKLHNQVRCEELIATLDKQGCQFNATVAELIKNGFIVNGCVVLTLYLSPVDSIESAIDSKTKTELSKLHGKEIESFKSQLLEEIKVSTNYNEIKKKVQNEITMVKDDIRKVVNTFDDNMALLIGGYYKFKDIIDQKIKSAMQKLENIGEPVLFCDIELQYDNKMKTVNSLSKEHIDCLKKKKTMICNEINYELGELNGVIHGLSGLRSITHYPDRFYGLLSKKLPSEKQVYWNSEHSIVVLKCPLRESRNVYKRFTVNIDRNSVLSIEGVNTVEINKKKASAVTLHNHFDGTVLMASKSMNTYVFSVNVKELKKRGFIVSKIAVFTILT